MSEPLNDSLRDELVAAAASSGCELLEAELAGKSLRVILDHPDGVTLAHCEEVSRKLSAALDVLDYGESRYVLEVSSPGLDRKLYSRRDYRRFEGHLARITWDDPEGGKRTDVGRLQLVPDDADEIVLTADGGGRLPIALERVMEARLEIEL